MIYLKKKCDGLLKYSNEITVLKVNNGKCTVESKYSF